ncbi:MAG: hypothetical protein V4724_23835 [Pseudomonadota bacterium]
MEHTTDKLNPGLNPGRDLSRDTITQIGKDTRSDLHSAIDRTADKVQPATDRAASVAHTAVDKIADKVQPATERLASSAHTAVDKVSDTANQVGDKVTEGGKQLSAAYQRFADTGRGYVRTSPAISVLVAMAAGYGLSKLFGSHK